MKRNSQLIDSIIELVHSNSSEWIPIDELAALVGLSIPDVDEPDTFRAHVDLCIEAGWLDIQGNPMGSDKPHVVRLTWAGQNAVAAGQGRWQ